MAVNGSLRAGRESFRRQAWAEAFAELSSADRESALGPDDLECLAVAAYLLGMDGASAGARARAFSLLEERGEARRAVRCAFWLAFELMNAGNAASAGGWLARARRLLQSCEPGCVEGGFLLLPDALQAVRVAMRGRLIRVSPRLRRSATGPVTAT